MTLGDDGRARPLNGSGDPSSRMKGDCCICRQGTVDSLSCNLRFRVLGSISPAISAEVVFCLLRFSGLGAFRESPMSTTLSVVCGMTTRKPLARLSSPFCLLDSLITCDLTVLLIDESVCFSFPERLMKVKEPLATEGGSDAEHGKLLPLNECERRQGRCLLL
jgi:hypothetical protein